MAVARTSPTAEPKRTGQRTLAEPAFLIELHRPASQNHPDEIGKSPFS
jgi:hypothetical protein